MTKMPFDDPFAAGSVLIREALQSPDYVTGVSGWAIKRDGTVEFNVGTFRGSLLIGTTPNPRIADVTSGNTAIAALQVKYGATFIIGAARLFYFNATDFYFEAVGLNTTSSKPELRRGEYFPSTDTLIAYEFYSGGTAVDGSLLTYGSAGNSGGTTWLYRNGLITLQVDTTNDAYLQRNGYGSNGSGYIMPTEPMFAGVATNVTVLSNGTEVALPTANWDAEFRADFPTGHIYEVRVGIQMFSASAGFGQSAQLRVRQGQASITGNTLAQWACAPESGSANYQEYTAWFRNALGSTKSAEYLSLTWQRDFGAANVSMRGGASGYITLRVYDLGPGGGHINTAAVRSMT